MNLIIIDPKEIKNNKATLSGRRGDHIRKIIKPRRGDTLKIGLINGPTGTGRVIACGRETTIEVRDLDDDAQAPDIIMITALPRPIMLRRVLAQAAAFGVKDLHLINSARVEKSFFSSSLVREEKWREFLVQGLEQGGRTRLPRVLVHKRFRPFVEDLLPGICGNAARRFLAHPASPPPPTDKNGRATVAAIGPEGGWTDFEVEKFLAARFTPISLGTTIMRVDWAVPALLATMETTLPLTLRPAAPLPG